MARKFTVKLTKEELATKLADAFERHEEYNPEDLDHSRGDSAAMFIGENGYTIFSCFPDLTAKVIKDLEKVEFSTENIEATPEESYCGAGELSGFRTLPNGLTYFGMTGGGDWEQPFFFLFYFDGKEIRAYIPKAGNSWDHTNNKAFGNADDDDEDAETERSKKQLGITKDWRDAVVKVDCKAIVAEIQTRIKFSGSVKAVPTIPTGFKEILTGEVFKPGELVVIGDVKHPASDTRYPYADASDYIRLLPEYEDSGPRISRSNASQIREGIALALGMEDQVLAEKLADYFRANIDTITEKGLLSFLRASGKEV